MIKRNFLEHDPAFGLIDERLQRISQEIAQACSSCGRVPEEITVMAVTKTVSPVYVNYAVDRGNILLLGENRAQELCEKYDDYLLKRDQIHFIGHLQTNKVSRILDKVSMIQSVDSLKLAQEIQCLCEKQQQQMEILLEVNIGQEESKSGVLPQHLFSLLESISQFPNLRVRGLMAIPPIGCGDLVFGRMQELFSRCQACGYPQMDTLSIGMSGDYPTAIRYGATIIRLGSAIFGRRDYR